MDTFSASKTFIMLKALLLLLPFVCSTNLFSQGFQPVNAFHREKDYPRDKISTSENLSAVEFIRQVVGDFELPRDKMLAILVNGKYEARVHGNGDFDLDKTIDRLNDKIILGATEHVEARYDPNFNDPWNSTPYIGTINFVIPALTNPNLDPSAAPEPDPEPWENPMTKRLLAAQEPERRTKHLKASSSPRAGLFVGSQLRVPSIYIGFPVEVPVNKRLSLHGSIMWNWKIYEYQEIDTTGLQIFSKYVERAVEASVLAKYHFNQSYPRFYVAAGPYLERDRAKRINYGQPEDDKFGQVHTALGLNAGLGVLFYSRFDIYAGLSVIFTRSDKLLPYQDLRGASLRIAWLLGKR